MESKTHRKDYSQSSIRDYRRKQKCEGSFCGVCKNENTTENIVRKTGKTCVKLVSAGETRIWCLVFIHGLVLILDTGAVISVRYLIVI